LFAGAQDHVPNQLIVHILPGENVEQVITQFAHEGPLGGAISTRRVLSRSMNIWLMNFNEESTSTPELLDALNQNPHILSAQLNRVGTWRQNPNDNTFSAQWSMDNTGQQGGTPDADIDATEAWDITTGGLTALGDTIVVAVIDGGLDMSHEDLIGNLWRNYADPPNSIDDDNNGYTDDFRGWDFFDDDDQLTADFHGTPIAGIIGATGNNGIGIAGINWQLKIMGIEAAVNEADVVEAYSYVLEFRKKYNASGGSEGAFVVAVNSSWGIDQGDPADYPLWCAMYDSMGAAGILNAAATANRNWDIDQVLDIPTACASDYLISVTNMNRFDQKIVSAGFGATTIDLGAPGEGTYGTYPTNNYASFGGTSGATPHVTGAIALLYATTCEEMIQDAYVDPAAVALQVKDFILNGVDPNADLNGITVTGGRLNLYRSLILAENYGSCLFVDAPGSVNTTGLIGLHPNPANDYVRVTFSSTFMEDLSIVICNVLGQQLRVVSPAHYAGEQNVSINVSNLSPGVYFVYVLKGLEQSVKHKLIIH